MPNIIASKAVSDGLYQGLKARAGICAPNFAFPAVHDAAQSRPQTADGRRKGKNGRFRQKIDAVFKKFRGFLRGFYLNDCF